ELRSSARGAQEQQSGKNLLVHEYRFSNYGRMTGRLLRPGARFSSARSSSARFWSILARFFWSSCLSKNTWPSMNVVSQLAKTLSGWALQMARSASLPTSSDPTFLSMPSCSAPLYVMVLSASSSVMPPYFTSLAASMLRRRTRSSESELIVCTTPWRIMMALLYGIASYASILYDQLSANELAPAP